METPFINDAFSLVYKAFKNLYPDKDCVCQWIPEDEATDYYGVTTFCEDGTILVDIAVILPVKDAVEVFAHELAHVAVGESAAHSEEWEKAFDSIFEEYNRIITEL